MEDNTVEISELKHGETKKWYKINPKINEIWGRGSYNWRLREKKRETRPEGMNFSKLIKEYIRLKMQLVEP